MLNSFVFFRSAVMPRLDYTTEELVGWRYDPPLTTPHSLPPPSPTTLNAGLSLYPFQIGYMFNEYSRM